MGENMRALLVGYDPLGFRLQKKRLERSLRYLYIEI